MAGHERLYRSHADYTIACICPMGVELAALEGMLDEIHDPLPVTRDQNAYTLGTMGDHSIVVAVMPKTGISPASRVATQLQNDFPAVRFGLLIGIGGGVPGTADIRLGDVVVSQPTGTFGGVVQYDLGKRLANGKFKRTGKLNEPPEVLSANVRRLESQHRRKDHKLCIFLAEMLRRYPKMAKDYSFPDTGKDYLFESSYQHSEGATCDHCDPQYIISRPPRLEKAPVIHYGTIASVNVVVKDAMWRDELKKDQDMDILCVEMEAAGLMNSFPCLVIRGICDYADSHKNDRWQPYAAAMAAAYMKELLMIIPAQQMLRMSNVVHNIPNDQDSAFDKDIFKSLAFSQMRGRRMDVQMQVPHSNTCRWILDSTAYQEWDKQSHGMLWIKGKPGAGKSTLMSYLYTSICDRNLTNNDIRLEFFFTARGTPLQHTLMGMLRSMLHQLFQRASQCQLKVRQFYREKCDVFGEQTGMWEWHERELRSLLLESLMEAGLHQQILVFVDALDEAGEADARTIAGYLHSINDQAAAAFASIKVCISCRHYPIISTGWGAEVCVEDYNHADIVAYVHDRFNFVLESTGGASDDFEVWRPLQEKLIERSHGVFLWICQVMKIVEKCIYDGSTPQEVWLEVQELPEEISDVYEHILDHVINPRSRSQSFLLFQWICLAEEPLTLTQMRYALAATEAVPWSPSSLPIKCESTAGFIQTDAFMRQRILALSGGLLEVVDNRIQVGHQTVREFFLQRGLAQLAPSYSATSNGPFYEQSQCLTASEPSTIIGRCHSRIYWCCLKYLATEMVPVESDHYVPRERVDTFLNKSPLLSYAAENVWIHAKKAEQFRTQSLDDQVELIGRVTVFWTFVHRALKLDVRQYLAFGRTPLHIAASAGLDDIVTYLLNRCNGCDQQDQFGYTALHLAAYGGHERAVKSLIDRGANIKRRTDLQQTALALAAVNGHLDVIRFLLEKEAEADNRINSGADALQAASQSGHEQVVRMIISSGVNVNAVGGRHNTALYVASQEGHAKIVQMLTDAGANVNSRGEQGTALYAAARRGNVRIAQMLIDAGADVNASTERYGTALCAASWGGHYDTVKVLLNAGATPDADGGDFGTALYAASSSGFAKIVRLLVVAGADVNARGGRNVTLRTALSQGQHETVQKLMDIGANADLGCYGTALYAASVAGYKKSVSILINAGADLNVEGGTFGTALQGRFTSALNRSYRF